MSLLDEIQSQVANMSEEELRAEFLKAQEEKSKRVAKQKEYNAKPELKAKRLDYQKQRNEAIKQDPVKYAAVKEQRKLYMAKNKDKQKAYRDKRNALNRAILARAKELGITAAAEPTTEATA